MPGVERQAPARPDGGVTRGECGSQRRPIGAHRTLWRARRPLKAESCHLVRPPSRSHLVGRPPKSLRHNDAQHGPTTHFTPRHLLRRRLLGEIIVDGYIQTLPLSDSPAREVQQRFRWLQRRDDCNQERDEMLVSCVRSAYEERAREITSRLEELNATVATQIAQAADTGAAQQGALGSVANPDLSPSEERPIAVQPTAQVPSESTTSETTEIWLAVMFAFLGLIAVAGIGLIWGVYRGAIRTHRYAKMTYGYSPFSRGIVFVLMGLSFYLDYALIFFFFVAAPSADTGSLAETTGQVPPPLLAPALLVLVLTYLRVWHKTNWWISAFSVSVLLIVSPLLLVFVSSLLRKGTAWLDGDNAA